MSTLRGSVAGLALVSMFGSVAAAHATCEDAAKPIACGETINGQIDDLDCVASYPYPFASAIDRVDIYYFEAPKGPTYSPVLTIGLGLKAISYIYDNLFGIFPIIERCIVGNGPPASCLQYPTRTGVSQPGRHYLLVASTGGRRGNYSLTFVCDAPPAFPAGAVPFTDSRLPGYHFAAAIHGAVAKHETSCLQETVCLSSDVPGRSEALVRIIGPRPNGLLWPFIAKFTPDRLQVWIQQDCSGKILYLDSDAGTPLIWVNESQYSKAGFAPCS